MVVARDKLFGALQLLGVDVRRIARNAEGVGWYLRDLRNYRARLRPDDVDLRVRLVDALPILHDRHVPAGLARGHYFHQDLWAARKVFSRRPASHLDVGSRIDGFVSHLLTFMDVDVVDIRPLRSQVSGVMFLQDDGATLGGLATGSRASVSSLHAVEHFGLGRYGDPVDPYACFRAMRALARVLAPGGHLYFSVPVGRPRVCFNAHRVFAPERILREMSDAGLDLESFGYVDDAGDLHADTTPSDAAAATMACGLFEFKKSA